jgi:molecular chaperone DnaK
MYGIDFGTTNSSICQFVDNVLKPLIISNNSYLLKSIISIVDDNIFSGILVNNAKVIYYPKRRIDLQDKNSIIESSYLLNKIRQATGKENIEAVVTIPVNYNHSQREATKVACNMANINVLTFINEPTAIAFSLKEKSQNMIILDIGGGTIDISYLEYDRDENYYQVIATDGDSNLGSEDVNILLYDRLKDKYNNKTYDEIRDIIEHIKLNSNDMYFEYYESFCEKIFILLNSFIQNTEIETKKIIMAGGGSRLFGLKEYLFNKMENNYEFILPENPELLVSMGACIYSRNYSQNNMHIMLIDIVALSLGVENTDGQMIPIIDKGSIVPLKQSKYFTTDADENEIEIKIYQGERKLVKDNFYIGSFIVKFDKTMKKGEPKVEILFSLDLNHILTVTVKESKNQIESYKQFTQDNLFIPQEQIQEMIEIALINKEQDEIKEKELQLSSQIYNYLNILQFYPDLVSEDEINEFKKLQSSSKTVEQLTQLVNTIMEKYPFVLVKPNITPFNMEDEIEEIDNTIEEFEINCHLDDEEEYNVLVTNLLNNIQNFGLSEEKQEELIIFIDTHKYLIKDYKKGIDELNEYCQELCN